MPSLLARTCARPGACAATTRSCRAAAPLPVVVGDESEALDLVSCLGVHRRRALPHLAQQPLPRLARGSALTTQFPRLCASAEDHPPPEVAPLAAKRAAQLVKRLMDRRRFRDRVARAGRRH